MASITAKCECGASFKRPDLYLDIAFKIQDIKKYGKAQIKCCCGKMIQLTEANIINK